MSHLFLVLLIVLKLSFAHAESGWSGNGGDGRFTGDNVWNLGSTPVSYCLSVANDYPFSKSDLEELVKESFEDWSKFFSKYQINSQKLIFRTHEETFDLPPVTLNFLEIDDCGNVEQNNSLQFLFGLTNDIVKSYTQFSGAELKFGAAVRPEYNHKTKRNGGHLWFANFTRDRARLKHLILHEIGHTLGLKHDSVYVMDEKIGDLLQNPSSALFNFGQIEDSSWPFMLTVGGSAELTTPRGKIIDDNPHEGRCEGLNYLPNRILPQGLLKRFSLLPRGCHKLILSFEGQRDVIHLNNVKRSVNIISLSLVTPRGQIFKWAGEFVSDHRVIDEVIYPSVFTSFNGKWGSAVTSEKKQILPAKGFFKVGHENIAAQIDLNKGIQLEIFFPEVGRWFSTSTY